MKSLFIGLLVLFSLSVQSKDYVVSPYVTDAGIQRVDDLSFRYVIFGFDTCFRVELLTISGINKKILVQKDICSYAGKNFATDFSYVGFQNMNVVDGHFVFNLNTMPRRGLGEYDRQCTISINGSENRPSLSDMTCTKPVARED